MTPVPATTIRYWVTVKGNERVVDVTERGEELEIRLDDQPVDADLTLLHGAGLYSLLVDGHSREMVLDRASTAELRERAVAEGMISLRHDGLKKLLDGQTTLEEILRETNKD